MSVKPLHTKDQLHLKKLSFTEKYNFDRKWHSSNFFGNGMTVLQKFIIVLLEN